MKRLTAGTKWILTLVAAVIGIALLLYGGGGARILAEVAGVPESRRAMGINLPAYRMDQPGVPINDPIVDDLEALGAKWMRFEFRAKGSPPIVPIDDYHMVLDRLRARGIHALGLLDYATVPRPRETWGQSEYREAFASRVASLVAEFKDDIGSWEIWNEEDIGHTPSGSGGDTYMSPEDYAYLVGGDPAADPDALPWAAMGVYQAIKEADPYATVLLGGLSNAWKTDDGKGAGSYLEAVYQALADPGYGPGSWPFDVVAVHPYYGLNPDPGVYLFSGGDYVLRANLWTVMNEHGDGRKRFWVTEIGWNTNTIQWSCMPPFVSEENQAAYLETSWDIFLGEPTSEDRVLVDTVFWYQYQDTGVEVDPTRCPVATATPSAYTAPELYERVRPPRVTPTPGADPGRAPAVVIDSWWGLVHGDYAPKPSYYAYRDRRSPYLFYLPVVVRDHGLR
jgi:hypothetical protein